jgi:hypothetical protein
MAKIILICRLAMVSLVESVHSRLMQQTKVKPAILNMTRQASNVES